MDNSGYSKYWIELLVLVRNGSYWIALAIQRYWILSRERCVSGVTSSERVAGEVICEVAEARI